MSFNARRQEAIRDHRINVAVYGDVDMNLLDGSAVWLASLAQTLALGRDVEVQVVLKAPRERELLLQPLERLPNLELHSLGRGRTGKLKPQEALDLLEELDRRDRFAAILLRGFDLCCEAAGRPQLRGRLWCYLTDIPQRQRDVTREVVGRLRGIARASQFLLCQTEALRSFLEANVEEACWKTALLPPMLPEPMSSFATKSRKRIVYAGKFAPLWATREMVEAFRRIRERHEDADLHVFGDKIHDPPNDPTFKPAMESLLRDTEGLVWHGAKTREEVLAALPTMDVAWSWRLPQLDDSLELSTKVLEYGAAGVPALLSRNEVHEAVLGRDYPLFATSLNDAEALVELLWSDAARHRQAARAAREASASFTFPRVRERYVVPLLRRAHVTGPRRETILIAGHDLRFIRGLREWFERDGYEVLVDTWRSHTAHDETRSRELLGRADVVVSEWCLGNAVWLSHNVRPNQRLVIRLHLQERDTPYPAGVNMSAVHKVLFVGQHILEEVRELAGWPAGRLTVVPNTVDCRALERDKLQGAGFNLGLSGICPARKRLDLALDILEHLRSRDERFTLYVKGRMPWEYDWLWLRDAERKYFETCMDRIRNSPLLRRSVVFDEYGPDVAAWYRKIGFVLSTSDFESFHLAVAEGAASGAVPVVLPWDGADAIYPADWLSESAGAAARRIERLVIDPSIAELRGACRQYARERFDIETVASTWNDILFG